MSQITRRRFVESGMTIVALASLPRAKAQVMAPSLGYPATKIGSLSTLKDGVGQYFAYPDDAAQGILLKLGKPAIGGLGQGRDIVAYSAACTHMGCGVAYKGERLQCPCHYSLFDPAKNGQVYQGLASSYLPQIPLRIDANGDIYAVAVEGLIWGRARNVLPKGA